MHLPLNGGIVGPATGIKSPMASNGTEGRKGDQSPGTITESSARAAPDASDAGGPPGPSPATKGSPEPAPTLPIAGDAVSVAPGALDLRKEADVLTRAFPDPIKRFEFLYGNLSILDTKASSLMAFNAIGLTALAVWLEYVPSNLLHLALDIVFVLLLLSSAICFWVVRVHWSPPEEFEQPQLQTITLLETRKRRTGRYRAAWLLSVISVAAFGLVSSIHMLGTGLHAGGLCGGWCERFFSPKVWGNRESQAESAQDSPAPHVPKSPDSTASTASSASEKPLGGAR